MDRFGEIGSHIWSTIYLTIRGRVVVLKSGLAFGRRWHDCYGCQTLCSAEKILPHIFQLRPVKSILEDGCGHGHWLKAALALGVEDVIGIDGDWTDRAKLLFPAERFGAFDLGEKVDLGRKFDLVISLEVGEHLNDHSSEQLVDTIVRHADLVLFGAAIPYQGGYRHINEQWPSYWREIFRSRGYISFDIVRPEFWTDRSIHYYYRQNALFMLISLPNR